MQRYYDKWATELSADAIDGLATIVREYETLATTEMPDEERLHRATELLVVALTWIQRHDELDLKLAPKFGVRPGEHLERVAQNMTKVKTYVSGLLHERDSTSVFESYMEFYEAVELGLGVEFSDDDLAQMQSLINEMRKLITTSEMLSDGHRARLLKRLERLQQELHRTMSTLDRAFGTMEEVLRWTHRHREELKPVTDLARDFIAVLGRGRSSNLVLGQQIVNHQLPAQSAQAAEERVRTVSDHGIMEAKPAQIIEPSDADGIAESAS